MHRGPRGLTTPSGTYILVGMSTKTPSPRPTVAGRVRDPEATRERILECAFDEMYREGYGGASLDQILADSGVTKGALYYHFGSKAELAVAVIEEVIRPGFLALWIEPVMGTDRPIEALITTVRSNLAEVDDCFIECGCPLNNLSQELSASDERFRKHLNGVFDDARSRLARALKHGQELGTVRAEVDVTAVASFVLAGLEGLATTLKTSRDLGVAMAAGEVFLRFLDTLATDAARPAA